MRKQNITVEKKAFYCISFLLFIMILYVGNVLNQIGIQMYVNHFNRTGIDYDAFSEMNIPITWLNKCKKNIDVVDDLTASMLIHNYQLSGKRNIKKKNLKKLNRLLSQNKNYNELRHYYYIIIKDIKAFPIPFKADGGSYVSYDNTWHALRSYGGMRQHEGTDLMPEHNISGLYPVLSMTDGVVEKIGWLEKGGYRIGIRSLSGVYYYYAHLDSYAKNIKKGDSIKAGQLLGYMGDSGYGPEGTTGMFDVHLHLGIYLDTPNGEQSVNPYHILLYLETKGGN